MADDYISREEVLSRIYATHSTGGFANEETYLWIHDAITNLSAADVQPVKHGRWINLTPTGQRAKQRMTWHGCVVWMCSECHGAARFFSEDLPYELCPHCGAIMTFGGGEEEQCAHAEYMERAAKECASEDGDSNEKRH